MTMGCGDACPIYPGQALSRTGTSRTPPGKDLETCGAFVTRSADRVERPAHGDPEIAGQTEPADDEPVAVITDIHGNLPALEAALARIDELGIDADLLRRRPGRLRPPAERGLRA